MKFDVNFMKILSLSHIYSIWSTQNEISICLKKKERFILKIFSCAIDSFSWRHDDDEFVDEYNEKKIIDDSNFEKINVYLKF